MIRVWIGHGFLRFHMAGRNVVGDCGMNRSRSGAVRRGGVRHGKASQVAVRRGKARQGYI